MTPCDCGEHDRTAIAMDSSGNRATRWNDSAQEPVCVGHIGLVPGLTQRDELDDDVAWVCPACALLNVADESGGSLQLFLGVVVILWRQFRPPKTVCR